MNVKRPLLVVVPAYNEQGSLPDLSKALLKCNMFKHSLLIDDCSTDNTLKKATELGFNILHLPVNLGIGGAVQSGYRFAVKNNYTMAAQVDGDGQHPPSELNRLLESLQDSDADLVIGSRYLNKSIDNFRSGRLRRLGSSIISLTLKLFFGIKITDPTSGFRIASGRCLELFAENYPVDYPEPVSIAIALKHGLKVQEVHVQMEPRTAGISSISGYKTAVYMCRVILSLLVVKWGGSSGRVLQPVKS